MTVQLSVTVWTVICFILLMVILKNLLFKPVLKVLDGRRERVENARKKQAEYDRLKAEHEADLIRKKKEHLLEKQKRLSLEVEKLCAELKESVDRAQDERLASVDSYRESMDAEHGEILRTLSSHSKELAEAFAESITRRQV